MQQTLSDTPAPYDNVRLDVSAGERSRWKSLGLVIALGSLNTLTPFSIDLYLSTFPQIASDLGTTVSRIALTVSAYFIGYALGQILYGPFMDRFGRKPPIYVGLSIYILASIGCVVAGSVESLLVFRALSALGGAAASVGAVTMVRDLFPPRASARVFSYLMLVLSVSPLFAPSVGSLLAALVGWRSLFAILAGIAFVNVAIVAFALPVTAAANANAALDLASVTRSFVSIFRNVRFRVFTLAGSLSFSSLFVFVAGSPSIFMDEFQLNASQFGATFAVLAMGMIGGGQLNNILMKRTHGQRIFNVALVVQLVGGAVALTAAAAGVLTLVSAIVLFFVILVCAGITYPNAAALALEPFAKNAGSAASLLGFLQLGLGAVVSAGVGVLNTRGSVSMAVATVVSCGLALLLLRANSNSLGTATAL